VKQGVKLRRIGNPPSRAFRERPGLALIVGRRTANPPQISNLRHNRAVLTRRVVRRYTSGVDRTFLASARVALVGLLLGLAGLAGCAHRKHARHISPPPPPAVTPAVGDTETGIASWYGKPYHGRPAANGEIYDMDKLTAAHRTLPFNTWVRVYDLDNNKTVEVRITDRGPFIDGRIIDLSHAAAREIEMIGPGIAQVRVEIIRAPAGESRGVFAVQVGAFRDRVNAERVRGQMESLYGSARVVQRAEKPGFWFVLAGREATEDGASALASRIRQNSGEKNGCFVVRVDAE
jgi:rare lipoprotein A